ncbi:uncharacterized mitochondrial protein-like protein, partial [Tanacetum coccineum]
MTGNISYLSEYEPCDVGYVSFGHEGGKITGKVFCSLILSALYWGKDFKLDDNTHVLLRTPKQQNMYSIDLKNIVPRKNLTCLIAKAFKDESMLWHRRLGHLNFKTMNKLVRNNLVKGLPSKSFENIHTCVACLKGKQHKASCKTKLVNSITKPLHTLHMNLFGPTSVSSLNQKWYCLVVTDDFSRTLIEAARTMLADAKLPVSFWAEAVNTACYVQNKVLVNKSQNKTPYELFNGRFPAIGFLRPFGCHVMILNTLDHLGKFDAKEDEGTSSSNILGTKEDVKQAEKEKRISSKIHSSSKLVEHEVNEEVPKSSGISFPTASSKESSKLTSTLTVETTVPTVSTHVPTASENIFTIDPSKPPSTPTVETTVPTVSTHVPTASENIFTIDPSEPPSTPTVETTVPTISTLVPTVIKSRGGLRYSQPPSISNVVSSENRVEDFFEDSTHATRLNKVEADLSNMETIIQVSPTPTLKIHKDHPNNQIIGPVDTPVLTRHKSKNVDEQSFLATIHQKIDLDLLQLCLFSAFLSQEEPKKFSEALKDSSWVEAMQEEL